MTLSCQSHSLFLWLSCVCVCLFVCADAYVELEIAAIRENGQRFRSNQNNRSPYFHSCIFSHIQYLIVFFTLATRKEETPLIVCFFFLSLASLWYVCVWVLHVLAVFLSLTGQQSSSSRFENFAKIKSFLWFKPIICYHLRWICAILLSKNICSKYIGKLCEPPIIYCNLPPVTRKPPPNHPAFTSHRIARATHQQYEKCVFVCECVCARCAMFVLCCWRWKIIEHLTAFYEFVITFAQIYNKEINSHNVMFLLTKNLMWMLFIPGQHTFILTSNYWGLPIN